VYEVEALQAERAVERPVARVQLGDFRFGLGYLARDVSADDGGDVSHFRISR
jgi:hypothetical protein